jgi:predicted HTH transcriptional regulator
MNASELQQLVAQGEGRQLEFKRSLAELETAARTVVAFANTDGGVLLFGVRDAGDIIGVEIGQNTKERISSLVTETSDPVIYPSVEFIKVGERAVIAVRVEASENRPHLCKGRTYKRVGAADVQLSRDEYERLLLVRATAAFDRQPLEGTSQADLSEERVRWYLRLRAEKRGIAAPEIPLPDLWLGIGAVVEQAGRLVPTRAGILCFGKHPQQAIPIARCAWRVSRGQRRLIS